MKRSRIRPISEKRQEETLERQELRRKQLSKRSLCEARIAIICSKGATDVHELINRSQRSTAWLEPDLYVSLCRPCHTWVTDNPSWAYNHGLHLSAWHFEGGWIEAAGAIRGSCLSASCAVDHMPPNVVES